MSTNRYIYIFINAARKKSTLEKPWTLDKIYFYTQIKL